MIADFVSKRTKTYNLTKENHMDNRDIYILILLSVFIILILNAKALFSYQNLTYGCKIKKITLEDYNGRTFCLPVENSVNIIFFFNIKNPLHLNTLSELNFLFKNINQNKTIVNIVGITKENNDYIYDVIDKLKIDFFIVNDVNDNLSSIFDASCRSCLKIIIIDKSSIIRYMSSQFDALFLREIVQRYALEEK